MYQCSPSSFDHSSQTPYDANEATLNTAHNKHACTNVFSIKIDAFSELIMMYLSLLKFGSLESSFYFEFATTVMITRTLLWLIKIEKKAENERQPVIISDLNKHGLKLLTLALGMVLE
jgi:hypothetical protein